MYGFNIIIRTHVQEQTTSLSHQSTLLPIEEEPSVISDNFVIKSATYSLNAVYTYIDDGKKHPAVLMIAGSGPADHDATIGTLKPFSDIADGLAENGICSLRVDKRTLNYPQAFVNGGIEEEYLEDCRVAINYLKKRSDVDAIYSLGGQIACILQSEIEDISGTIIFNSSLRHLADIACDQYSKADPANKSSYVQYTQAAKNANYDNAREKYYYYGVDEYYWASYNNYDFSKIVNEISKLLLVINSKKDLQMFAADIELWKTIVGNQKNVSIVVDGTISHFGYEVDFSIPESITKDAEFPKKVIDMFSGFIYG